MNGTFILDLTEEGGYVCTWSAHDLTEGPDNPIVEQYDMTVQIRKVNETRYELWIQIHTTLWMCGVDVGNVEWSFIQDTPFNCMVLSETLTVHDDSVIVRDEACNFDGATFHLTTRV